jgi:hypothetical protein
MNNADKKELTYKYIGTVISTEKKEFVFRNALRALNPDNEVFSLVPDEYSAFLNELFASIVGPVIYDWVSWWIYETEDQKPTRIWVDGEEIAITCFDDLWEAVLKDE